MKKIILLFLLQVVLVTLNAQEVKFGKISNEDFVLSDTTSAATVLFKKQKMFYDYRVDHGFVKVTEHFKRIQINRKGGLDFANVILKLYDENAAKKEIVIGIKGFTYNLVTNKVEKTKLKSKEIFEEKYSKYRKKVKIAMPNVKVGSVIDIKYVIESPFASQIDDVVLQEDIPVKEFDCELVIPEYYMFNLHENIKSNYKIKIIEEVRSTKKDITWRGAESFTKRGGQKFNKYSDKLSYKERVIKFNEKDIVALKKEEYSATLNNYVIKLAFDLQAFKSFSGQIKNYASNWGTVTEKIYESGGFGGELNEAKYFKKDIDNLIKGTVTAQEKVNLIFNFVKSKVRWNDNYGYFVDSGVKKAYRDGEGNVADINLMLVAMLRYAKINANPVLVSTKSNGEPLYCSRQGFNYVICGVEVAEKVLMLDATDKYSPINLPPQRVLNWQGRIVRERGSSAWVNLLPQKKLIFFNNDYRNIR